jgi:cold shock CspA family protein
MSGRLLGQVKWFNNKAGYGFITMADSGNAKDVFAHYSNIKLGDQYKYLVQGEYVEFELAPTTEGTHEFQAINISGVNGGQIMCEVRRQNRASRIAHQEQTHGEEPRVPRPPRREPREPREAAPDDGFKTVRGKRVGVVRKPATEQA